MLQQIRIAMGNASQSEFFDTIVEIDETYVGGIKTTNTMTISLKGQAQVLNGGGYFQDSCYQNCGQAQ
ncbi:MAG: hypothetical protein AAGU75_23575 [Bacillota bacterium]